MKDKIIPRAHSVEDAAGRVAEISALYASIRQYLTHARTTLEANDTVVAKTLISKISELQSAHLKLLSAEEAFHAHQEPIADNETIDVDTIRAEIGRQIARIRTALDAERVSIKAE